MKEQETEAAELLTSAPVSANYAEFHESVGSVLAFCRDDRIDPEEAIYQIGSMHEQLATANEKLRAART